MVAEIHSCDEIPTPALVLDSEVVRINIRRLADYATTKGLKVRPHTKTHKMRALAEMQLDAGASGITVAKVSEAEIISAPGSDVLLAYPPVGPSRAARLATLARDRTIRAAVDSLAAVNEVSSAAQSANTVVGLLVELDVGMGRTGVASPLATLPLVQAIDRAPNVRLDGIMVYPGHIWDPIERQDEPLRAVDILLEQTIDLWSQHGFAASIVSGGSTPTAYQSHLVPHLSEIRPGTYIFNDMNTVRGGFCLIANCAARLITTVISDAVAGQVVIDAGSKTLSNDLCLPAKDSGYGYVFEYPEAIVTRLSEEHGQLDVTSCEPRPVIGERLTIIPNHICPCLNLQDSVWWERSNESLELVCVDARGKIQ
ncbi:MAG: alanine racemase [Planctomycetota bacterium]|nr:alanine racemase [Planctomycetota bacterium]